MGNKFGGCDQNPNKFNLHDVEGINRSHFRNAFLSNNLSNKTPSFQDMYNQDCQLHCIRYNKYILDQYNFVAKIRLGNITFAKINKSCVANKTLSGLAFRPLSWRKIIVELQENYLIKF